MSDERKRLRIGLPKGSLQETTLSLFDVDRAALGR